MDLHLRDATAADAYALWTWANDGVTRAASGDRPAVEWAAHVRWLDDQLQSDSVRVYIAETGDRQPVGSIRFDTRDAWGTARLSYVIAPEARGRHLSKLLVSAGVGAVRERHRAAVYADVLVDNERSLRVFRGLGWREKAGTAGMRRFWFPEDAERR